MANRYLLTISLLIYLATQDATEATIYVKASQIGCRYYQSICQRNEYCSSVDPRGVCLPVNAARRSYVEELIRPEMNNRGSYEVYFRNPELYDSQLAIRTSYQDLLWKWYLAQRLKQQGWQEYENINYQGDTINPMDGQDSNHKQSSHYLSQKPNYNYEFIPETVDSSNHPDDMDNDENNNSKMPSPANTDQENQPGYGQPTDHPTSNPTSAAIQTQTPSTRSSPTATSSVTMVPKSSSASHPFHSVTSNDVVTIKIKSEINPKVIENNIVSLENYLHLRHGTFSNVTINGNNLSFTVNPNIRNVTATIVLDAIYHGNSPFKAIMQHSTETPIDDEDNDELHITLLIWIMVAVLVITALVSLFVFVFKKGKPDNKEDMVGLLASESDITDYEDLCRQHVASKKSEMVDGASGKIITIGDAEQVTEGLDSVATSWSHEPVTADMDISTCHVVLSYMEDHLKNKDRLMKEWEALLRYKVDRSSGLVASRAVNIRLNRYSDTFPYDHNRVVLTTSPTNDNDYINASYIYDHNPRNPMYIATQGPIPNTKAHFWQMVWEQKIATVVMLARLKENDVAVCALYWPEKKGKECYGDFEVTLVSEHNWCDDYVVRNFYLRNIKNQETRTVTQFQYLSWPDMGIPKDTKNFLEFRRKINRSYHGQGCPVIIHCNDGAGRAGTYILIDMTLKRLSKGTKEIDIAATIEHLRDQRISMVKTKVQFEFALSSIAEEVNDILNALK